ncbi:hypothetical protein V8C35DRAFT_136822 [Trichoderma chlorosporum]
MGRRILLLDFKIPLFLAVAVAGCGRSTFSLGYEMKSFGFVGNEGEKTWLDKKIWKPLYALSSCCLVKAPSVKQSTLSHPRYA